MMRLASRTLGAKAWPLVLCRPRHAASAAAPRLLRVLGAAAAGAALLCGALREPSSNHAALAAALPWRLGRAAWAQALRRNSSAGEGEDEGYLPRTALLSPPHGVPDGWLHCLLMPLRPEDRQLLRSLSEDHLRAVLLHHAAMPQMQVRILTDAVLFPPSANAGALRGHELGSGRRRRFRRHRWMMLFEATVRLPKGVPPAGCRSRWRWAELGDAAGRAPRELLDGPFRVLEVICPPWPQGFLAFYGMPSPGVGQTLRHAVCIWLLLPWPVLLAALPLGICVQYTAFRAVRAARRLHRRALRHARARSSATGA